MNVCISTDGYATRLSSCGKLVDEFGTLLSLNYELVAQDYGVTWDTNKFNYCGWDGIFCGDASDENLSCLGLVKEFHFSMNMSISLSSSILDILGSFPCLTSLSSSKSLFNYEDLSILSTEIPSMTVKFGSVCCGDGWFV